MEKYEEFGKFFNKSNIKIGASISFEDENNLLKEIQGAANAGVQHIEITSLARHGGSRSFGLSSSITSEIRRIAKLNGVTLGVHASPFLNICGFENNGFSMESRNRAIEEGKASIDFADAIKARLVVLHPNSFPRPISDINPGLFSDENTRTHYLVDPRNEEIMAISEQESVFIPQQAKDAKGNLLWLLDRDRKPILDSVTGKPIPRLAVGADGRIRGEEVSFRDYICRMKKEGRPLDEIIKSFLHVQRASEINRVYLRLQEAERALTDAQSRRDKLQDTLEYYRNLNRTFAPEDRWRLERNIQDRLNSAGIAVPSDLRSVESLLVDELQANQGIIEASRQSLTQGWPQLSNVIEQLREITPLKDYGLEKIADAVAELTEYSIGVSNDNPIHLAIENLASPQMYGSSASELLEIIEESRKRLAFRLQERGRRSSESKSSAKEFIGATLDIGHLNVCRQFYRGDAFHKWMVSQARDLANANVIFNLHLSDNRGMDDSHLLIGEGNSPIKEILGALLDFGYKGFIVVESAGSPAAVRHAMNLFGILPRETVDELERDFNPRDAISGLKWKDDPERPSFGRDD